MSQLKPQDPSPWDHIRYPQVQGRALEQSKNIDNCFPLLAKYFVETNANNSPQIIEIGVRNGGFSLYLRNLFPEAQIDSWEIQPWEERDQLLKENNITIHLEDCFQSTTLIDMLEVVGRPLVLLCDGGNKPKEFNTFAPCIQVGSLIMAHDYVSNGRLDFTKWEWMEIQESDIVGSCEQYNLKPFYTEEFESAFWLSRIKQA
jgi:hypothetical protein